jgi:two-component system phosphate regulon sensor histidine kinase PhoR
MRTLRGKMTDLVAIIVVLVLLSGWFLIGKNVENQLYRQAESSLTSLMEVLSAEIENYGVQGLIANADRWKNESSSRVTIITFDGRVLYDNKVPVEELDDHGSRPEVREAILKGFGKDLRYSRSVKDQSLYMAKSVADKDGNLYVLRISLPLSYMDQAIFEARKSLLFSLLGAGFIALIVGIFFSRQISKPLEDLTNEALKSERGRLSIGKKTNILEVFKLSEALEGMSRKLDKTLQDLKREQSYLESLLDSLPIGVMVIDKNSKIRYANNSIAYALREDPKGSKGLPFQSVIKVPELINLLEKSFKGEDSTIVFTSINKTERYLQAQSLSIEWGVMVVVTDMTERVLLEEARKAFVADASHELQTPLTIIRGAAELLMENEKMEPKEAKELAKKIITQQERMTGLVDDLLLLSRLEARPHEPKWEDVDLAVLLKNLVNEGKNLPAAEKITLEYFGPKEAPTKGDAEELRRAFWNLLENAIKYTRKRFQDRDGGKVVLSLEKEEGHWIITVDDNGIGVPYELKDIIFERFQRGEKDRSREASKTGGYGLGLAIAQKIIKSHGGTINLEDKEEGALFRVKLPSG